jgi:hypothetical protein
VVHKHTSMVFCPMGILLLYFLHGLEDNSSRRLRRLRAPVDTGEQESAKLPIEGMPLNSLGPRRCGRQNTRSPNQSGSEFQNKSEEEPMTN